MRVKWLSSAALLALIASPSVFAQQVSTNEPFTLKVSGSSRAAAVMLSPSNGQKEAAGKVNSLGMASRTRVKFNVDATVNGLGYGGAGQIDLKNGGIGLADVANVYVSPYGMGKITIGVDGWSADYAALNGGMLWGSNFGPDGGWGASATGVGGAGAVMADIVSATGGTDQGGMWDGGTKLSYTTPSLYGFDAIVAFETSDDAKQNNGGDFSTSGTGYQNIIQAGASYVSPEMGGVNLTVAGAFMSAAAKTTGKNQPKGFEDLSLIQGRVAVTGYGVMAQFVYLMGGKSGQQVAPKGYASTGDKGDMAGMSGSLAYAMGPAQVGVYYGSATTFETSEVMEPVTTTVTDPVTKAKTSTTKDVLSGYKVGKFVTTAIGAGASYNLAKGAQAFVGYETFTIKPTVGASETAGAATVGMQVSF